jgi:dTDP-4-dehydrorhamnose 3,5-epimerase
MKIIDTALPQVKIVVPRRISDIRGFFAEMWNARDFASVGIESSFVQDNHIRNSLKWTLRWLHYQLPPAAEGKLVRVSRGAIFDAAVDLRRGSPTFGRHAAVDRPVELVGVFGGRASFPDGERSEVRRLRFRRFLDQSSLQPV